MRLRRAFRSCSATSARDARSCSVACAIGSAARNCQQIDVERSATTPERFHNAIVNASPFRVPTRAEPASAREAFDATLAFLDQARAGGGNEPATFLLDEVLELRTFESFPGVRTAIRDLLKTLEQQLEPLHPDNALCLTRS